MNPKIFRYTFLVIFCFMLTSSSRSIVILDPDTRAKHKGRLLHDLQKATGLTLIMKEDKVCEVPGGLRQVSFPFSLGQTSSATARYLLLGAMNSDEVYRVGSGRDVRLGRSGSKIDLNFDQLKALNFRGVPRLAFGPGIIFLHELAHIHRGLIDPGLEQSKLDPEIKGQTVEFINIIQRELGLPERLHYFPKKLTGRDDVYCIYFGEVERVEMSARLFS